MEQVTSIPTPKTKPFPSHFKNTVTIIAMVASIFDPSTPEGASLVCRASARTAEAATRKLCLELPFPALGKSPHKSEGRLVVRASHGCATQEPLDQTRCTHRFCGVGQMLSCLNLIDGWTPNLRVRAGRGDCQRTSSGKELKTKHRFAKSCAWLHLNITLVSPQAPREDLEGELGISLRPYLLNPDLTSALP